MIGGFAVGKTSLTQRFVSGIFSDKYLTTVGVKIDKRNLTVNGRDTLLMVWDLAGSDEFASVTKTYLRGANGFVYVVDGTRKETLTAALTEYSDISSSAPDVPFVFLFNKCDLTEEWEVNDNDLQSLKEQGITFFFTSAKAGNKVSDAFEHLACEMSG